MPRIIENIIVMAIVMFMTGLVSSLVYAEQSNSNGNWDFKLAPMYLWAVSIDGDQTVKGIDVDMDVSFDEILDKLNGALIFHFEGLYKKRWGFFSDLNYIRLDMDDGPVDIDFTQTLFEVAGFYRLTKGSHAIDALGGLRYSAMDVELDLPSPISNVDQRKDWVDPYIGARWRWRFAEKWATRLKGDFGGFGIGSDRTWNLVGMIDFKPWEHAGLFGGYRALYQDYSTGSGNHRFSFDATMHGPILGLNVTW